jgi:hypothetical protein
VRLSVFSFITFTFVFGPLSETINVSSKSFGGIGQLLMGKEGPE